MDQKCIRVIGVITELDLMDKWADAINYCLIKLIHQDCGNINDMIEGYTAETTLLEQRKDDNNANNGVNLVIKTSDMNFIQHIKKVLPMIRETRNRLVQNQEFNSKYLDYENLEKYKYSCLNFNIQILQFLQRYVRREMFEYQQQDINWRIQNYLIIR